MDRKKAQILMGTLGLLAWGVLGAYGIPTARLEGLVNVPNPFDSRLTSTTILYSLPQNALVSVRLCDLLGTPVREWHFPAGQPGGQTGLNRVTWDGTDARGEKVAAGGYLCQVFVEEEGGVLQGLRKVGVIR